MSHARIELNLVKAFNVIIGGLAAIMISGCGAQSEKPAYLDKASAIEVDEYAKRRANMLETLSDGILLIHARSTEKEMEQWGFVQDASFLYFSGLPEVSRAILALDGPDKKAHLFLPPPPTSFGVTVQGLTPDAGAETAAAYQFDAVQPWDAFLPWVEGRIQAGVKILYVDEPRRPEPTGVPAGMRPVAGDRALWKTSLQEAFPSAEINSAKTVIMAQKAVKSPAEINILEQNAQTTVLSLLAVARQLEPGVQQRYTEAAVVETCLKAGGEGPSFWPWTMSGPNAHFSHLASAFYRYTQGDRVAQAGELVRIDIGCAGGFYGADVGRTLPVSGKFTAGQAETWDLLISGYLAGLSAMADGIAVSEVRSASMEAVRTARATLKTSDGKAAAEAILAGGESTWHIHGVGIESGESIPDVLQMGMVVAYEPGFAVGKDAYYLEDMILITTEGHRVLSSGLPYSAGEIERIMKR